MKRRVFMLLAAFAVSAGMAGELTRFSPEKSQISFVSKQMGVPVDGRFRKFDASIAVDPAKPESGKAQFEIDLSSIDTGSADADSEVKGKNWFNTAAYPKAGFVSSQVRALGGGRYEALGKLTIKGHTRDVAAAFAVKPEGGGAWFDGGFTLSRLAFKIGEGVWADTATVSDEVQIKFRIYVAADSSGSARSPAKQ